MDSPLLTLRNKLDLTLRELSAETGASKSKLWRIEQRKQDPDMELLRQLAALANRRKVPIRLDDFLSTPPVRA